MQIKISNGDNILTLLRTIISLLLATIIKHNEKEKRKATFKKRPPEGSKLTILATPRKSSEKPSNFLAALDILALKKRTDMKITLKYDIIFL